MATTSIWPGSSSFYPGDTPFGSYDKEKAFQADIEKTAVWCAKRIGYPIVDIELQDTQFFACFEEAVTEYSSQVNRFNIRENLLIAKGSATGTVHRQHLNQERQGQIQLKYGECSLNLHLQ